MSAAAAHPQAERDAKARRELSRASGVALIGMSAALEEGLIVGPSAGPTTLVLVAFAARARRLLRSAYRLIDAGERDTAMPLIRVMSEYLIVSRWLLAVGDDDLKVWAIDDLHRRLTVLREVIADKDTPDEVKGTLTAEVARTEDAIGEYGGAELPAEPAEVCPECQRPLTRGGRPRPPSLQEMARVADLSFAYSYSYRLLSQYDVHASVLAIDSTYEQTEHGHQLRPVPQFGLEGYDSYQVGAMLLLDILQPLTERVPELRWEDTATMVRESLAANAKAAIAADRRGE